MRTKLRPMVVKPKPLVLLDRPGWIPPDITQNWDPDPYAYQTEEEMMPAGGQHGQLLGYLMEVLRVSLKKRDLMLLMDTFMLYRDTLGTKRRIAPDLQLIPYSTVTPESYDLERSPPPYCVVEVVSPKSADKDLKDNVALYLEQLQIPSYLVIEPKRSSKQRSPQIQLHLWRLMGGRAVKMSPDTEGKYALPEIGLNIVAKGQGFAFTDALTGEEIFDVEQLGVALEQERYLRQLAEAKAKAEGKARRKAEAKFKVALAKAEAEALAREAAEAKAEAEAEARKAAEAKAKAEAEARRAAEAKTKAVEAKAKAEVEARRAAEAKTKAVEEELSRLRAQLAERD